MFKCGNVPEKYEEGRQEEQKNEQLKVHIV